MNDLARDFRPILVNLCRQEWAPFLSSDVSPLTAISIGSGGMNNELISNPNFDVLPKDERAKKMLDFAISALKNLCFPQPSDDDLTAMIGDTLFDAIEEHAACVYGDRIYGSEADIGPKDYIGVDDGDLEIAPLARAVLEKLRAEGVIR